MAGLQQIINQLNSIRDRIPEQARMIVLRDKEEILDLIRLDQLFEEGIDGTGTPLMPYTPFTMAAKRAEGRDPNIVTLFDTGDFYRGFDLLVTDQDAIGVFSRDEKTPELVERYGQDIFTFTQENNRIINQERLKPELLQWVFSQVQI